MGISGFLVVFALGVSLFNHGAEAQPGAGLAVIQEAYLARTYKNYRQFHCGGADFSNVGEATAADYARLDRELTYANSALLQPEQLAGEYVSEQRDEENRLVEFRIVLRPRGNGELESALRNWNGRFDTDFTKVDVNTAIAALELQYPGSYIPIRLRPVAGNKLRYSYSSTCSLNFPTEYTPVYRRAQDKKTATAAARRTR